MSERCGWVTFFFVRFWVVGFRSVHSGVQVRYLEAVAILP